MKLLLSTIFTLCITFGSFAQIETSGGFVDATTWGSFFDLPRNENIFELVSLRDGTPVLITGDNDHLYLRAIDKKSLALGATITLTSTEEKSVFDYYVRGDSLYTLIRSGKRSTGYSHELVIYRLTKGSQAEVYRNNISLDIASNEKSSKDLFFSVSDNGNFTSVVRQTGFLNKDFASFFISITDNQNGTENHYNVPTQITGDDLDVLGISVGENGLVYMVCLAGVQLNSPFMKKYLLYVFNQNDKTLHEFDFATQEIFTKEMVVNTTESGMQVASLYHTDPLNEDGVNGYAFIQFDTLGQNITQRRLHGINSEMVKKHLLGDEMIKGNEVKHFFIDNILHSGNTPFVVFEKRYKDEVCQTDPRTGIINCTDQFHYDGVSFENLLDEQKSITIPRKQIDFDFQGNYTSHQLVELDHHIAMLYNDHHKNTSTDHNRIMNNVARSALRLVLIDENGIHESFRLTLDRQNDFAFMSSIKPEKIGNDLFVLGSDGKGFKIGRIDLNLILNR